MTAGASRRRRAAPRCVTLRAPRASPCRGLGRPLGAGAAAGLGWACWHGVGRATAGAGERAGTLRCALSWAVEEGCDGWLAALEHGPLCRVATEVRRVAVGREAATSASTPRCRGWMAGCSSAHMLVAAGEWRGGVVALLAAVHDLFAAAVSQRLPGTVMWLCAWLLR